jgi:DNA helicase-2/ATP-dependent DNA helicase PcrA
LLDRVRAVVDAGPSRAAPSERAVVAELEHLRDALVGGSEAKDAAANLERMHQHEALLKQLRSSRQAPQIDPLCPYFAHLRLREDGREWDLCVGRATYIERDVSVVDWRNAPISRIFYRYREGEEYAEEIAGRIRLGTVAARRHVTVRSGVLERVESPAGRWERDPQAPNGWRQDATDVPHLAGGEGATVAAYTATEGGQRQLGFDTRGARIRRSKVLPDIAGLIDPTQFEVITRPGSGLVVVRGTAGSGKTTVALHRIAYLAYDDPQVDSARTLVVVFSPALRRYIAHVLPALDVGRVAIRTFAEWASELRHRLFPNLPRETRDDTPAVVHRLKLHPAMLSVLDAQCRRQRGGASWRQAVDDWGSALGDRGLLGEVLARVAPGTFSDDELDRVATWGRDRHREIGAWLGGDRHAEAALDSLDDALLLRAWQLRVGPLVGPAGRPIRYRHLAIDEVQDFSPLEVRVLLDCTDDHRSVTLAGDTQQHVMQDAGFTSWDAFFDWLGVEGTAVDTLKISYRSSHQIVAFAQAVLGPLREDADPPMATRPGPPVELFRFTDQGAAVAFLADGLQALLRVEPHAAVAVLAPTLDVARAYHRGLELAEVPRVRLVVEGEFPFVPGVDVTDVAQAKGLEFDYVVLVDVSADRYPDSAAARRLLHVGATRAIHQLWLTSIGTPSPIVREALVPGATPGPA